MTIGKRKRALNWSLVVLLALPCAGAQAFTLADLQTLLGGVKSATAGYTETRHLAILDIPVVSRGTLIYRAPDYLEKRVTAPNPARYRITGDQLTVEQNGQRRTLDLTRFPALRAFTESLRATLSGDFADLRRLYAIALNGVPSAWTLRLTPEQAEMARFVDHILVDGSRAQVRRFTVFEHGGDSSELDISPR